MKESLRTTSPVGMAADRGYKRRFLLAGIVNVLVSNFVLQVLLLVTLVSLASLLSQVMSMVLGYYLYGKAVFGVSRFTRRSAVGYGFMAILLWLLNWSGISLMSDHGINKNLAALIMIPILPVISYLIQKNIVFAP